MDTSVRQCVSCGKTKPLTEFHIQRRLKNGEVSRRPYCKDCWNKAQRCGKAKPSRVPDDVNMALRNALLQRIKNDPKKLKDVTKKELASYTNYTDEFDFDEIVRMADEELHAMGKYNPKSLHYIDNGEYLVIGDTFGRNTTTPMFRLLQNVIKELNIKVLIVIGHNLDDEDILSYHFSEIKIPVVFVASPEEMRILNNLKDEYKFSIVQDHVTIGGIKVCNQQRITPYVRTPLANLDPRLFPGRCIVNCTRHEYSHRPSTSAYESFICSPGSLAEPFVIQTVTKLDFTDGIRVKQIYMSSFHKYRKAEEDKEYWEKGMVLVHHKDGYDGISMMRVHTLNRDTDMPVYGVATTKGIITSTSVEDFDRCTLLLADIHMPYIDEEAWDTMDVALEDVGVDGVRILGDVIDYRSMNPHILGRGETPDMDVLEELDETKELLQDLVNTYGEDIVILRGNHDNFMDRWTAKNPQFRSLLCKLENEAFLDLPTIEDNDWIMDDVYMHHGDAEIFGVSGNNLEKSGKMFQGEQSVIGHTHSPAIRGGCYRLGCMCDKDQGYNEPAFSNWGHGAALLITIDHGGYNGVWVVPFTIDDGVGVTLPGKYTTTSKCVINWGDSGDACLC